MICCPEVLQLPSPTASFVERDRVNNRRLMVIRHTSIVLRLLYSQDSSRLENICISLAHLPSQHFGLPLRTLPLSGQSMQAEDYRREVKLGRPGKLPIEGRGGGNPTCSPPFSEAASKASRHAAPGVSPTVSPAFPWNSAYVWLSAPANFVARLSGTASSPAYIWQEHAV